MDIKSIIKKLYTYHEATEEELIYLIDNINLQEKDYLRDMAHETSLKYYGNKVYIRGLIEFTNYCFRNCNYCGIRHDNNNADRYRLSVLEIMYAVKIGYSLGYRTFVLQGGEDSYYTDEVMIDIISRIKKIYPDCAITISIGERSYDSYKKMFDAGADRYLLRHETASEELYRSLHPNSDFNNRRKCLYNLKEIGYQVGAGFMIGLPNQTTKDLVKDLFFIKELQPAMVGIGPFIPHKDTPLRDCKGGTLDKTLIMLSLIRLMLPEVLLPATTALGSINPLGRELGLKAGANVVMPNLSPTYVREKYSLYNGKICTGDEAAECRKCIERRINNAGFELEISRGDNIVWQRRIKEN